jgi:hypothetical protein
MRVFIVNQVIHDLQVVEVVVLCVFPADLPLDQALQASLLDLPSVRKAHIFGIYSCTTRGAVGTHPTVCAVLFGDPAHLLLNHWASASQGLMTLELAGRE